MREKRKTAVTTVKFTPEVRDLWERCAEREHRSLANSLEVMVRSYARQLGIGLNPEASARRAESV